MKNLRQLCVAVVLILVITAHTFAGDMHTLIADPPPPPSDSQIGAGSSEAIDPVAQIALNVLQSVLSLF